MYFVHPLLNNWHATVVSGETESTHVRTSLTLSLRHMYGVCRGGLLYIYIYMYLYTGGLKCAQYIHTLRFTVILCQKRQAAAALIMLFVVKSNVWRLSNSIYHLA